MEFAPSLGLLLPRHSLGVHGKGLTVQSEGKQARESKREKCQIKAHAGRVKYPPDDGDRNVWLTATVLANGDRQALLLAFRSAILGFSRPSRRSDSAATLSPDALSSTSRGSYFGRVHPRGACATCRHRPLTRRCLKNNQDLLRP
jgi:hypothetical protein